jgi:hypothetical protein
MSRNSPDGLLFYLVESVALDMNNTRRGYRYAIFNVFGTCLERPSLDESYKTSEQARKALYAVLDTLDAKALTLAAIDEQQRSHAREMESLRIQVSAIGEKIAA